MSRKKSGGAPKRSSGGQADAPATREAVTASQKAAAEDLGEFAGITMGDVPAGKAKESGDPMPSDEKILLSVGEDRARLALQGIGFLLLAFLGLFLVAGGFGATQISQNILYMLLLVVGLPLAWFASKAMGLRLGKLFARVGAVDFGERHVVVYERADAKKARVLAYKDIKNYKLIRQGKALRLLLAGDWVTHPSGFYLVDINRPFMADTLDGLEEKIVGLMREHRVNVRR